MKSLTLPNQMNEAFAEAYNSGDIDNLMMLFESHAQAVTKDGKILTGYQEIKDNLIGLLKLGGRMTNINKYAVEVGDIALLRAEWKVETKDENGQDLTVNGSSAEVVRKQKDGAWLYIIDHPFGAE